MPEFANLFGDSYQAYVGEAIKAAAPSLGLHDERIYLIGSREKRTVDWIASEDHNAALFIECKVKRMRMDTKLSLTDTSSLEEDVGYMASAVVQTYRTIQDCLAGRYPHFKILEGTKVYPCIVTLENWHMHGPVMYGFFRDQVRKKMAEDGLPDDYIIKMPYSVWPIDDFELGLQIMNEASITTVMDGKLLDSDSRIGNGGPTCLALSRNLERNCSKKTIGHCFPIFIRCSYAVPPLRQSSRHSPETGAGILQHIACRARGATSGRHQLRGQLAAT